ncbi:MAG: RHS repeat-associated core domain-containing protein, partial [Bacteroidaceae bacterium]|nr:RHS repeat-associated core domain-containing protein [Bacteroidaceae bacterium]
YPFGAEFCDGSTKNYNQKRKYNGKEFDNMHGLNTYDYGARQYNPVTARWDRMDPLAEKYSGISPYAYCMGNPIIAIDPDGKEGVVVHGTWSDNTTWENIADLEVATNNLFNDAKISYGFKWSGGNSTEARSAAAKGLVEKLKSAIANGKFKDNEQITLIGHSHGGNVIIEAVNQMTTMKEFEGRDINILTINTPVRSDYQLSNDAKNSPFVTHVNVYDPQDPVQVIGGRLEDFGIAGRTFPNARNIKVDNPQGLLETKLVKGYDSNSRSTAVYPILTTSDFHNSHNRVNTWINQTRK